MAIRALSTRGLHFSSTLLKELDSPNAIAPFRAATAIRGFSSSRYIDDPRLDPQQICQHISQLPSTLAAVRKLESQGLSKKQAEAISRAIIEFSTYNFVNVSQSNAELQKMKIERHFGRVLRETEMEIEKLKCNIEKLRCELRLEIHKLAANQKMELDSLRAYADKAHFDFIKYCIGTLSFLAVGVALCYI